MSDSLLQNSDPSKGYHIVTYSLYRTKHVHISASFPAQIRTGSGTELSLRFRSSDLPLCSIQIQNMV